MIRVIAFDSGGVLFAEGKSRMCASLVKSGRDPGPVERLLQTPKRMELRKGFITADTFWNWAQTQLPEGYDVQEIRQLWYDGYVLDDNILDLMKLLGRKYTLIAFSGNFEERIEYLDKKYQFRQYFAKEVYSFNEHTYKGEAAFAHALVDTAGVPAHEIVHVDDIETDLEQSKKLGVHTIIYERGKIEKLRKTLRELGVNC